MPTEYQAGYTFQGTIPTAFAAEQPQVEGQTGVEFIPQYFRQYPQLSALNLDSDITASKIYKQRSHVYARELDFKFVNMIMADQPKVKVYKPDGTTLDQDLTAEMGDTARRISLTSKVGMSWSDAYMWYGMAVSNPIFNWRGGNLELDELIHLPAHLFDVAPPNTSWAYSQILQGVVYNPSLRTTDKPEIFGLPHVLEFYQRQNPFVLTPVKLNEENLFYIRNPNSSEVAGEPLIKPLMPILDMITFFWNCEVQRGQRVGAPTMMFEPTGEKFQPANEHNGQVSDQDYLNMIAQNQGKDNFYMFRRSFKLVDKSIDLNRMVSTVTPTLDMLKMLMVDSMTPGSFVSQNGTLIGGNNKEAGEAMRQYIQGTHETLSDSWSPLFQYLLNQNGYEDYTARLEFPALAADRSDIEQKWGAAAPNLKCFSPNEVRAFAKQPPISAEMTKQLADYWNYVNPPQTPPIGEPPVGIEVANKPESRAWEQAPRGSDGMNIDILVEEARRAMKANQDGLKQGISKALDNEFGTKNQRRIRTQKEWHNILGGKQ